MRNLLGSAAAIFRTEIFGHSGIWAQKKRVLSRAESSEPGLFDIYRSPFFIPIYEAIASGKYRRIVIVCGSQMGKTEFILNRCGHKLDTSPVPITLLFPTEGLAKSFSKNRFIKMLKSTPDLYAKIGYCAAKKRAFVGYRTTIISTNDNMAILDHYLTPANQHDSGALSPLLYSMERHNVIDYIKDFYGDNAYNTEDNRDWLNFYGINCEIHTKDESGKHRKNPRSAKKKSKIRRYYTNSFY